MPINKYQRLRSNQPVGPGQAASLNPYVPVHTASQASPAIYKFMNIFKE